MRPIYKSLALASTVLQVSLALNAQTRDDESASTMALPADLLDSLRVELVALNVSGARNLIESGECVIDGSNLTITLDTSEWTRGAMYRLQVLATFGTQTQVIYALNITVPYYAALSSVPQEYEDTATVVSTISDVTEADLEGLALEETSQEIKAAITPISLAAEAYNTGKVELADNLVFKGVQASASETLPELAAKVRDIAQTTTEIVGGEMYGAQLFGDANPAQSPLWNLYDVLAQMKTRFMGAGQYAALIVCGYDKGYDSLQLQGADAYYTCDGDFYDISSPLHVWHDSDNDKDDRWVCFLYSTAGARLDITNTAIPPRRMYIGGHFGTIEYFVNGRLEDFVCGVEETDILDNFNQNGYTQAFSKTAILRNVRNAQKMVIKNQGITIIKGLGDVSVNDNKTPFLLAQSRIVHIQMNSASVRNTAAFIKDEDDSVERITIEGDCELSSDNYGGLFMSGNNSTDRPLKYIKASGFKGGCFLNFGTFPKLEYVEVGPMARKLYMRGWKPDYLSDTTKVAKVIDVIKNGILARVGDRTGLSQLTFTIGLDFYNAIASEQIEWQGDTMSLADAFLTKNWLLAGA